MAKHVEKMTLNDASSDDLNIFYYGGCGGFYLLHQLLLTENFYCDVGDEYSSYLDINEKQFNVQDMKLWKINEVWPKNMLTKNYQTSLRKIYFNCNNVEEWFNIKEYKICLYTDLKTQLRMSMHKKSYFYDIYNKDYNEENYISFTKSLLKDGHNNMLKYYKIPMKKSDLNVRFQDLLSLKGLENFLNSVGCELKQKNIDFLKHYLSLHPTKLLQKIGVSSEVV